MRLILFSLLLGICHISTAQVKEGFDLDEVKALIAICNSYTFEDLYESDKRILPRGYKKIFTSEVIGLDNRFQVYKKGKLGVINFRGSTDKFSSWVENVYSAMIPAEGIIKINEEDHDYKFAKDTSAAVHSGFALAVVLLSPVLIEQIHQLNKKGIYNIIVTGHSQGGALSTLCRAYLENLPDGKISSKNNFKTYAFANPMVGNEEFSVEYYVRYSQNNSSYSIINPTDLVTQMPMHYQEEGKILSWNRFKDILSGKENLDIRKLGVELIIRKFERGLTAYVKRSNKLIEKMVSVSYTSIEMPAYKEDINFFRTGIIKELPAFPYPKVPLDISEMSEKEQAKMKPNKDGNYYKKEPNFFQHKPYNYYVAVLKEYSAKDYKKLKIKCLPENL